VIGTGLDLDAIATTVGSRVVAIGAGAVGGPANLGDARLHL
jgi:hypothetical protein